MGTLALDLTYPAQNWDIQDVNEFNKLPYYFAKDQVKYIENFQVHQKYLGTWNWQPKNGTTVKTVRKEMSPFLQSEFFPAALTSPAKRDVISQREVTETAILYHHKVESMYLHFLNDFQDFLPHAENVNEDMSQKIAQKPDLFYRSAMFHGAPYVYVMGVGLVSTDFWINGAIAASKDAGDIMALCQGIKPVTYQELDRVKQIMGSDIGAVPRQGMLQKPGGKNEDCTEQTWTLVGGSEVRDNIKYDPFILANRPLGMDLLSNGFKGKLAEDLEFETERFELRYLTTDYDANNPKGTAPGPQTFQGGNVPWINQTEPNPAYTNAQVGVMFLYGDEPYKAIKPGPPPSFFAGSSMSMDKFNGLNWNGKVSLTRNLLIDAGANQYDTNKYGELAQYIAYITMGILPSNRKNVLPIMYLRSRAGQSVRG